MTQNVNRYSELANNYPDILINADSEQKLNTEQISFLKERLASTPDISLEIGCGSGAFILQMAEANPEDLHIGIELRYKRSVRTVQKAEKLGIKNLLIIRIDAHSFWDYLPTSLISKFYLNFPDPWEKSRWLKHRMFSEDFLNNLVKFGAEDFTFSFKTDHEEYFHSSKKIIDKDSRFQVVEYSEDLHNSEYQDLNFFTEFERLFQSQRKSIYYFRTIN